MYNCTMYTSMAYKLFHRFSFISTQYLIFFCEDPSTILPRAYYFKKYLRKVHNYAIVLCKQDHEYSKTGVAKLHASIKMLYFRVVDCTFKLLSSSYFFYLSPSFLQIHLCKKRDLPLLLQHDLMVKKNCKYTQWADTSNVKMNYQSSQPV